METKKFVLDIYKVEAEKYNKTREIQWKINLSIWTVQAVIIYAKLEHRIRNLSPFVQGLIFIMFAILHFVFIKKIHGSLNRSLSRMHNMASHLLEKDELTKVKWKDLEKGVSFKHGLWEYWQLGITGFLIFIFYSID